jgi:hypothetical protein
MRPTMDHRNWNVLNHHPTHRPNAMTYIELLKDLLVTEKGKTKEEAEALVSKHTRIVSHGIIRGPFTLRATAMAIEMAEQASKQEEPA